MTNILSRNGELPRRDSEQTPVRWKDRTHSRRGSHQAAENSYDVVNEILDEPPVSSTVAIAASRVSRTHTLAPTRKGSPKSLRRASPLIPLILSMICGACLAFAIFRYLGFLPTTQNNTNADVLTVLKPITAAEKIRVRHDEIATPQFLKKLGENVSLASFVSRFARLSGIPVTLDVDTLRYSHTSLHSIVPLKVTAETNRSTVSAFVGTLAPLGLRCEERSDQILVRGAIDDQRQRNALHDVSDLLASQAVGPNIVQLITDFVERESWKQHGGSGEINLASDVISVRNTDKVHRNILVFCEMLRRAQKLPLVSHMELPLTIAEIRNEFQRFERTPIPFFRDEPMPLVEVLAMLEKSCGCSFVVDWLALESEQHRFEDCRVTLGKNLRSLSDVLQEIAKQLDVTFRLIGNNAIEITTFADELNHKCIVIHRMPAHFQQASFVAQTKTESATADEQIFVDEQSRLIVTLMPQSRQLWLAGILDHSADSDEPTGSL